MIRIYRQKQSEENNSARALISAIRSYAVTCELSLPSELIIEKTKSGKPYLVGLPDLHFSISHSGEYWICAISDMPLGIDIQKHEDCRMNLLAKRFFHQSEFSWLDKNDYVDFFLVWTAKESYVKYLGQGIDESFGKFSVVDEQGIKTHLDDVQFRYLSFDKDYSLCICAKDTASVELNWLT